MKSTAAKLLLRASRQKGWSVDRLAKELGMSSVWMGRSLKDPNDGLAPEKIEAISQKLGLPRQALEALERRTSRKVDG